MFNKIKFKIFLITALIGSLLINILPIYAYGLTGWAWNENIGWISFSHQNCNTDNDAYYEGGGEDGDPPPADCPTSGDVYPYEVDLNNATGFFSGYAYSSNVGWIAFERPSVCDHNNALFCETDQDCIDAGYLGPCSALSGEPPDYNFNAYCNAGETCDNTGNCIACMNNTTGYGYGWAKIIEFGNDGWVKLGTNDDRSLATSWGIGLSACDIAGWIWNGSDTGGSTGIGWIELIDIAGGSMPAVINMTAPNWNEINACLSGALGGFLHWEYSDCPGFAGDTSGAYRLVIDDENISGSPGGTPILDTGKCTGSGTCETGDAACEAHPEMCKISLSCLQGGTCSYPLDSAIIDYNKNYYWWVKLWNDSGAESALTQFNTSLIGHNLTGGETPPDQYSFSTYKHKFPDVEINYSPDPLSANEQAVFTSLTANTNFYITGEPTLAKSCEIYCASDSCYSCSWLWETDSPSVVSIWNPVASTTTVIFGDTIERTVELTLTDEDGYSCSDSVFIKPTVSLPTWKEVKPE